MEASSEQRILDQAVEITWKAWIEAGLSVELWNTCSAQQMWDCLWTALLRSGVPEALPPMQWFWQEYPLAYAAFSERWNAGKYRKG